MIAIKLCKHYLSIKRIKLNRRFVRPWKWSDKKNFKKFNVRTWNFSPIIGQVLSDVQARGLKTCSWINCCSGSGLSSAKAFHLIFDVCGLLLFDFYLPVMSVDSIMHLHSIDECSHAYIIDVIIGASTFTHGR